VSAPWIAPPAWYELIGEFDRTWADYDAALKLNPTLASSLYAVASSSRRRAISPAHGPTWPRRKALRSDIADDWKKYRVGLSGTADNDIRRRRLVGNRFN
jgi:hypothetical protein